MKATKDEAFWCPFTPAGSMLAHLEAPTEDEAWENLIADKPHGITSARELQRRGFTVEHVKPVS